MGGLSVGGWVVGHCHQDAARACGGGWWWELGKGVLENSLTVQGTLPNPTPTLPHPSPLQVNPPNEALDPLIEKINFLTAQAARRMVASNAPRPGAAAAPIPQPLLQAEAPALAPGAAAPAVAAAHAVGSKPAVATTHAATTTTVVTEQ